MAHIALQPWMTEPKCHTQTQSSMRFRDLRTSSPLVCPTWSLKTLISEGTSFPRYSTSLGSHLYLVWVSWVPFHLPTLTSFWFYHSPLVHYVQGWVGEEMAISFNLVTLPQGTEVYPILSSALHESCYFEKPDDFNPDHFLDANGVVKKNDAFCPSP